MPRWTGRARRQAGFRAGFGWLRGLGTALTLTGVVSCGGSDVPTGPQEDPRAATISLSRAELSFSALGESGTLRATVLDQYEAVLPDAPLAWASTDPSVAAVSGDGVVTAMGAGSALVEVTSGSAAAQARITVTQVPEAIEVVPSPIALSGPGDTLRVVAVVRDAGGHEVPGQAVTWTSGDEAVLTVDVEGLLSAVSVGTTTLSAASGDLVTTTAVTVTETPASIVLSPDPVGLTFLGDTATVTADVRDGLGGPIPGAGVVWSSGDPLVATVDGGRLTAVGVGATRIVATAGPVADTIAVTVEQLPFALVIAPDTIVLNGAGDTLRVAGAVIDEGGSPIPGLAVTWSSGDETVASVSAAGLVTAVGAGTTTLEASSGALRASAPVTVTQTPASVTVTPDTLRLQAVGDTATIAAVVRDATGSEIVGASVRWSSSDTTLVVVSGEGLVTAVALGTATVTARAGDQLATAVVVTQPPAQAPSFSDAVNGIFVQRGCTAGNCHGGGAGDLTLSATAATSYANLVNVPAKAEPDLLRVKPGDAVNSYLMIKLEGRQRSGAAMPIGGRSLDAAELQTIRDWIDRGAPEN